MKKKSEIMSKSILMKAKANFLALVAFHPIAIIRPFVTKQCVVTPLMFAIPTAMSINPKAVLGIINKQCFIVQH